MVTKIYLKISNSLIPFNISLHHSESHYAQIFVTTPASVTNIKNTATMTDLSIVSFILCVFP